jgi:hypothetical protein
MDSTQTVELTSDLDGVNLSLPLTLTLTPDPNPHRWKRWPLFVANVAFVRGQCVLGQGLWLVNDMAL